MAAFIKVSKKRSSRMESNLTRTIVFLQQRMEDARDIDLTGKKYFLPDCYREKKAAQSMAR